jgi:hypothetical protein|tara:strand:+ start:296 stop:487 length:192 start_codon:yes stop_codon:yes gene_type:complete
MRKTGLHLARKFNSEKERKDYFIFPNKDSKGRPSTYTMNNKQMKEFEAATVRRIIRNVFHHIK